MNYKEDTCIKMMITIIIIIIIIESSLRVHANVQSMPTVSRLCCLIHRAVLIPAMVRATATDITIWAEEALSSVLSWSPVKNRKIIYIMTAIFSYFLLHRKTSFSPAFII